MDLLRHNISVALLIVGSAIFITGCNSSKVAADVVITDYKKVPSLVSDSLSITYYENGEMEYKFTTPRMERYEFDDEPYMVFEEGVRIETFDEDGTRKSSLVADYAKYLEKQPWVESYEAGAPLSEELYCHVSPVGIRGLYFKTSWESDFLLHFADGRRGIRELVREDSLQKASTAERLEFSRRYWAATDVDEWKVVLVPGK